MATVDMGVRRAWPAVISVSWDVGNCVEPSDGAYV